MKSQRKIKAAELLKKLGGQVPDSFYRGPKGDKGEKGDKGDPGESIVGPQGPAGKDGKDGYTPIKGKDYFDGKDAVSPSLEVTNKELRTLRDRLNHIGIGGGQANRQILMNGVDVLRPYTDINFKDSGSVAWSSSVDQATKHTIFQASVIGDVVTPPAGSNTEVQYNDNGVFGSSSTFTWNKNSSVLGVIGSVGIGTVTPGTILYLKDSAPTQTIETTSSVNAAQITFKTPGNTTSFGSNDSSGTSGGAGFYDNTANAWRFFVERTGDIGIGTDTPAYKLDVSGGDVHTDGNYIIDGGHVLKNSSTSNKFGVWGGTDFSNGPFVEFWPQGATGNNGNLLFEFGSRSSVLASSFFNIAAGDGFGSGNSVMRILKGGNVGLSTSSPTALLDVNSDTIRLRSARTPASASAAGNQGDICWDSGFVYVCVATNTWKRAALSTW